METGGGEHVAFRAAAAAQRAKHAYAATEPGGHADPDPGSSNAGVADKGKRAYTAEDFPWTSGKQLTEEQRVQIKQLLVRYADCFAFSVKDMGRCTVMDFKITTSSDEPIFKRRHRLSPAEWELVDARCKELFEAGLIRPSQSDYAAATVLPAKKDSQGLWTEKRMCGDYSRSTL